jgi:2-phosphosulfolactate phosphatase
MNRVEVLFTPAEFEALKKRDLRKTLCVVFDVLRATSSMVTALARGAVGIIPVQELDEALSIRRREPDVLLAGERDGVRITSDLTGSIAFDLGNSPREFTSETVKGKTIVMTTTNGTRGLRACAAAQTVLAGSFLNLTATAEFIRRANPSNVVVVCSGTFEEAAHEDTLAAGALCDLLYDQGFEGADSALMALRLFQLERADLPAAIAQSRNARRLLSRPPLRDDVAFCLQRDEFPLIAELGKDGMVRKKARVERKWAETRRQKPEGRKKSEIRNPN